MSDLLRVMSFNIRNTNAPDGPNHWVHRRNLWVQTVRAYDPDLLGIQEVWFDQYDELRVLFPDYGFVGVAREDGARQGEWALILFRTSRFEILESGNFWLSQTPDIVGSRSWDAAYVRICTWARLSDRRSGRTLLHANTHFDNEGAIARRESARLLRARLSSLAGDSAVLVTGDFNCFDGDGPYNLLVSPPDVDGTRPLRFLDAYREMHPVPSAHENSYHAFTGSTEGQRIDWILHTPDLAVTAAEIDRHHTPDGRYPSDHFPVTATFRWA